MFGLPLGVLMLTCFVFQEQKGRGEPFDSPNQSPRLPSIGDVRALIIGIDAYPWNCSSLSPHSVLPLLRLPEMDDLSGAAKDAKSVHAFLLEQAGVPSDRIALLEGSEKRLSGDAPVGAKLIETALKKMCEEAVESDWLWLVFAGHGCLLEVGGKREPFLLTQSTDPSNGVGGSLRFDELLESFNTLGVAVHRLVILDTCKSGLLHGAGFTNAFNQSGSKKSVLLSAAQGQQSALESKDGGFFIQALLRGMRGFGQLDRRAVTVSLAQAYHYAVVETAARSSFRQSPYFSGSHLNYQLLTYPEETGGTCANLLRIEALPTSHRSNKPLAFEVEILEPSYIQQWAGIPYQLVMVWTLSGQGPYETVGARMPNGFFSFEIGPKALHSGMLRFSFRMQADDGRLNIPMNLSQCQKQVRIRR